MHQGVVVEVGTLQLAVVIIGQGKVHLVVCLQGVLCCGCSVVERVECGGHYQVVGCDALKVSLSLFGLFAKVGQDVADVVVFARQV